MASHARAVLVAAVLATGLAAVPATADDAYGVASLPDATATWDGMLHFRVACAAGGPNCSFDAAVYDPSDSVHSIAGDSFHVTAASTTKLTIDPGGTASKKLETLRAIVVRLNLLTSDGRQPQPSPEPVQKQLTLEHKQQNSQPGPQQQQRVPLGPPTKFQSVRDKRGDSHGDNRGMDLVFASAERNGRAVIVTVRTAKPLPHEHDFAGNPAAPCFEIPQPPRYQMQSCGDARLRGYTMKYWPKLGFSLRGATARWTVPLKLLPKRSFKWRAYVPNGYKYSDTAPNKGFLTFVR